MEFSNKYIICAAGMIILLVCCNENKKGGGGEVSNKNNSVEIFCVNDYDKKFSAELYLNGEPVARFADVAEFRRISTFPLHKGLNTILLIGVAEVDDLRAEDYQVGIQDGEIFKPIQLMKKEGGLEGSFTLENETVVPWGGSKKPLGIDPSVVDRCKEASLRFVSLIAEGNAGKINRILGEDKYVLLDGSLAKTLFKANSKSELKVDVGSQLIMVSSMSVEQGGELLVQELNGYHGSVRFLIWRPDGDLLWLLNVDQWVPLKLAPNGNGLIRAD